MAGINLAGTIGMTGKRESILSDLPQIIQHTGDQLTKTISDNAERNAKRKLLQEKQMQDQTEEIAKNLKVPTNVTPEDAQELRNEGSLLLSRKMSLDRNPKATSEQKRQIDVELNDYKGKVAFAQEWHDTHLPKMGALVTDVQQGKAVAPDLEPFLKGGEPKSMLDESNTNAPLNNQITETEQAKKLAIHELPLAERQQYINKFALEKGYNVSGGAHTLYPSMTKKLPEKVDVKKALEEVLGDNFNSSATIITTTTDGTTSIAENNPYIDVLKKKLQANLGTTFSSHENFNNLQKNLYEAGILAAKNANVPPDKVDAYAKDFQAHEMERIIDEQVANEKAIAESRPKVNHEGSGNPKAQPISKAEIANTSTPNFNYLRDKAYSTIKDKDVASYLKEYKYNAKTKNGHDWVTNIDEAIKSATNPDVQRKLIEAKDANETAMLMQKNGLLHAGYFNDIKVGGRKNNYTVLGLGKVEGTLTGVQSYTDSKGNIKQALLVDIPIDNGGGKTRTYLALLDDTTNRLAFDNDTKGDGAVHLEDNVKKTKELLSSQGKKEGVKEKRTIVKTGKTKDGKTAIKYSDGTIEIK
jgi:hypothetical protein